MSSRLAAVLLLTLASLGCDAELYHGLSERQANEALVALREAGIPADKQIDQRGAGARPPTFTLITGRGEETRALRFLGEHGIPRGAAPRTEAKQGGLLQLPGEQQAARTLELAAELAATLESLPQVQEARVHLAVPDEDPLHPAGQLRPTAAVLLRLRGSLPLQPGEVERLVAGAVPGLDAADVTVVGAPAPRASVAEVPMVRVGPLWVAQGSQRLAGALLALCFLLLGALLLALGWSRFQRRQPGQGL